VRVWSAKHRRALLVWVLPYLLLTLANGGVHNDRLPAAASSLSHARCASHALAPDSDNCPACQWLLASAACHPGQVAAASSALVSPATLAHRCVVGPTSALVPLGRAPPSL
jgi:hypothetical protein